MGESTLLNVTPVPSVPRPGRLIQYARARTHKPDIEPDFVVRILGRYGLEMTAPPENLPFGWRNNNVVVHTSAGRKVLKRYREQWPQPSIDHEHSILEHLQELHFPAPRLVRTCAEETRVHEAGSQYALFEYIDGANYASSYILPAQRNRLLAVAGQALARFHRQLAGFNPQGKHHLGFHSYQASRDRNLNWHLETLEKLREQSSQLEAPQAREQALWLRNKSAYLAERLDQLEQSLRAVDLPRLVIHGDYGIHNLLFHPGGAVTMHDFELARIEWRLIDLVNVISRMDMRKSQVFLDAYEHEYALKPEEWQVMPLVWEYYRLRGAIQSWHNYFELGDADRLKAAQQRVLQVEAAGAVQSRVNKLKAQVAPPVEKNAARVLMVARLFHPWIGGTERQAHKLAHKLLQMNVPVEIVTGWWFRGTPQREVLEGVPVYRNFTLWEFFGLKGLRKFGGYLYILSLLWHLWRRRDEYEVIHVHGLNYHTFAAVLAAGWFKKKVITKLANSARASDIEKMRQDKQLALARHMLPTALKSDRFIALNQAVIQELKAVGVPPERITPLPNGVETDSIVPKSDYKLHQPARLIFVGRLHPQKGLDTLLHALQHLRHDRRLEEIALHLIGDGPMRAALEDLAGQLGLESQVTFHGESDQVIPLLQEADIFVLPSLAEGISNALLEAMACGLPALVSDIPGNRDVIQHGHNGLRFQPEDSRSLAENLISLLTQTELREKIGKEARACVQSQYSLDFVARQYMRAYRELLTGDRATDAHAHGLKQTGLQHDDV